jgi:hypothetical protein
MVELIIPKDDEKLEELALVLKAVLAAPTGMNGLVILDDIRRHKNQWNFLFLTKDRLKYVGWALTREQLHEHSVEALSIQFLSYLRKTFKDLIRSKGDGDVAEIIQ